MQIALIHSERRSETGAHFLNTLIAENLRIRGIQVKNFYPRASLISSPHHLKGIANILYFYSLLEHRGEILSHDLVHGTTYTPLTFLAFPIPVISHFGSTTAGFLTATPRADRIPLETRRHLTELFRSRAMTEMDQQTRKPLQDIADIENYVAQRSDAVIATSKKVRRDLVSAGLDESKVDVIHNAIEDYWFHGHPAVRRRHPSIVFLGRLGADSFTLKLKGVDRLVDLWRRFPKVGKLTLAMTTNERLTAWLRTTSPRNDVFANVVKPRLPRFLRLHAGSILFIPSRYEGFSLSLVEGMSQGLIPVTYPVGVAAEIIESGRNGFLVRNQAEAAEAASRILRMSIGQRKRMAREAHATALHFRAERMAIRLVELYRKVLNRPRVSRTRRRP